MRRIFSNRWMTLLILVALVAALPLIFSSGYYYRVAALVWISALAAIGLNILMGYAGQVSLGHAGFFGIGAYAVAHIKGEERPLFRVMDIGRIEKARAVSKSKNGPAWRDWWDEMAIKTVLRNLAKDLPSAAEIESLAARDDDLPDVDESTTTIDAVLTDEQRALPPSRLDVIEGGIAGGEE